MKKIISKQKFIIIISLLTVYVGGCNAFHTILIPNASLFGRDCSRELAVKEIDRGNDVFPEEITGITFYITGRAYPRGVIYFTGNVTFNNLKKWANKRNIKLVKYHHGESQLLGAEELKLKKTFVKSPYYSGHENGVWIDYDERSKKCYVRMALSQTEPLPRSLAGNSFKEWTRFFFPFFTPYWLDKTVKGDSN